MKAKIKITVSDKGLKTNMKGTSEMLFLGLALPLLKILPLVEDPRQMWDILAAKAEKEIAKREQKELEDEGESREADIKADK